MAAPTSATLNWNLIATGSDTLNGGGFDPGQNAGFFTDGAATVANTSAPVFTSASYNFVAGDVGAWVFIFSGTNWTPGWYQIASVASNAATLTAGIGLASLYSSYQPNTVVGCATVAGPSGATWSIDYSQQAAKQWTYADLSAGGAGSTFTSVGHPFGKQQVGNLIQVTGGANCVTGWFVIQSVAALVATFDRAVTTGVATVGAGGLGGALASLGQACANMTAGQDVYAKNGTYNVTSASNNVAAGCATLAAGASAANATKLIGYNLAYGDHTGTRPLMQAGNAISTFTMLTCATGNVIDNVNWDGAVLTSSRCISGAAAGYPTIKNCKFSNFTNNAVNGGSVGTLVVNCEGTACTTAAVFSNGQYFNCSAHDNTSAGFNLSQAGSLCYECYAWNNTGTTDGFFCNSATLGAMFARCTSYLNGRDGFRFAAGTATKGCVDCLSVSNVGTQFNAAAADDEIVLTNCYGYGGAATVSANISVQNQTNVVTLTAQPFNSAGTQDFSLNNVTGGGALVRAAGLGTANQQAPGTNTTGYGDVGAAQTGYTATVLANVAQDASRVLSQWNISQGPYNWGLSSSTNLMANIYAFTTCNGILFAAGRASQSMANPNARLLKCNDQLGVSWTDISGNVVFANGGGAGTDNEVRGCYTGVAGGNFAGQMYLGTQNGTAPFIYRSTDGGNTWTRVFTASGNLSYIRNFIEFNGKLYCGSVANSGSSAILYTSVDGVTWTTAATFTGSAGKIHGIYGFVVVGSTFYLTTTQLNTTPTGGFWSSTDGAAWTQLNTVAFTGSANQILHQPVYFNGQFWLSTQDSTYGCSVWYSPTGVTWTQVPQTAGGFGIGANEQEGYTLAVFGDTMFCGTFNQGGTGGNIWITQDGFSWYKLGASGMGQPSIYQGIFHFWQFNDRIMTSSRATGSPQVNNTVGTFPTYIEHWADGSAQLDKDLMIHTNASSLGLALQPVLFST